MDHPDAPPTLQSLFRATEHRQNVSVLALLTWVAACDGSIADDELAMLRQVAAGVAGGQEVLPAVIDVARLARPEDLELACRYVRNHARRADRPLLAQLFVSMAVRDGHLTVAENHVLRFLADLLGLPARKFAKLFEAVTHRPFPDVGDVSSVEWWRRREAGEEAREGGGVAGRHTASWPR
jgi:DnaJ like chaperone protein